MDSIRASADRLLIALILAAALHLLLIFGLHFQRPKPPGARTKSLTVTLIRSPTRQAPKTADFLAEQNQFGSGSAIRPAEPQAAPQMAPAAPPQPQERPPLALPPLQALPAPTAQPSPRPPEPLAQLAEKPPKKTFPPPPRQAREPAEAHADIAETPQPPKAEPAARKRRVLTQRQAEKRVVTGTDDALKEQPAPRHLSADLLSQQISEVSAEVNRYKEAPGRGPRTTFINSVNAHQHNAAAYLQAWQQKVERIGNLNYPEEARRQKLSGSLVLSARILPDGTLEDVKVDQSSGFDVLDEAAINIVRLAAPYAAFSPALRKDTDVLVITRTWRFYNDYRLEAN